MEEEDVIEEEELEEEEMEDEEMMEEEEIEEEMEEEVEEEREVESTTTFTGYGKRPEGSIIPSPRSKFLSVVCKKCNNKQTVFSKSAIVVHCQKCNEEIVIPTGGEAIINAKVVRVLG